MSLPIEELTPRQIVAELDRYIVGQNAAKKAVAVALRNRYRRLQLPYDERADILPKNILMIGPTGVGKTEIARRLAQLARAPFVKVEATKFTEVGYVGRDVESMVRDLVAAAVRLVEAERSEAMREEVERRVEERLVDMLEDTYSLPESEPELVSVEPVETDYSTMFVQSTFGGYSEAHSKAHADRRVQVLADLRAMKLEKTSVIVETDEPQNPFLQVFTPGGMEEMGIDGNQMGGAFGSKRVSRNTTVEEARSVLFGEEAKDLIDRASLNKEAIERAEQTGIIFIDEIDKVAGKNGGSGPDVSREGVQRDLLPVIEGSTVPSKFGPIRTDHILFVAAGAFHMSKPSDLIPELQGRLPIRVQLESLSETDFRKILIEPKNALTKQYTRLLEMDGVTVTFTADALDELAKLASEVNRKSENIGARRLHTLMEKLLEEIMFEAPEITQKVLNVDGPFVIDRLSRIVGDENLRNTVL